MSEGEEYVKQAFEDQAYIGTIFKNLVNEGRNEAALIRSSSELIALCIMKSNDPIGLRNHVFDLIDKDCSRLATGEENGE